MTFPRIYQVSTNSRHSTHTTLFYLFFGFNKNSQNLGFLFQKFVTVANPKKVPDTFLSLSNIDIINNTFWMTYVKRRLTSY